MSLITGKVHGAVLCLEFRDPLSRNSFSIRAAEELLAWIGRVPELKCRALVFSAPGRVFCSGGNLADYASMTSPDPGRDVNRRIGEVLQAVASLKIPTICAVTGDCFGGGLEVISAFDVVLSAPHALFGFWQRKIGLSFGWGGGARLAKRLGESQLKQMALSATTFGALEAHRLGLIDGICIEGSLMDEALTRARTLLELPAAPVEGLKNLSEENERATFDGLWWNDEHRAVLAKRNSRKT